MCARGLSLARKVKYLYILIKICKDFKKDLESFDSAIIQDFRVWVNSSTLSNATKVDYMIAVKKVIEFAGVKTDELKINRSKHQKLPTELLTEQEVQVIIDYCQRTRDKALFSLLYELGARIGEVLNMRVSDIVFDHLGAFVMLDGKTGQRRCRIVKSIALLRTWLTECPAIDSKRFLWIKQNGKQLGYPMVRKMLKDSAKALGINKRVYPHLFRHSRSTELAKHLTEQQLKVYLGWVPHSDMASVYIHLSGSDCDDRILEMNGKSESRGNIGEFEEFFEFYKMWKYRR
jgi:integrase